MENNHKTAPKILLHKGQGKDTPFQEQMQKVFLAFREQQNESRRIPPRHLDTNFHLLPGKPRQILRLAPIPSPDH